ncbi:Na-translocating system protein MpsC family protein [Paenibacillus sp. YPG26]|uniref:Na-translocating system protein MpsC family protein n=1 Tax=Paenibacillus sp. YPG26 TaxID=2878915 RepID=UPI0020403E5C|nr:Na-translocating system protein MpsC family protein [Paenibacillus sp. YPG26]USB33020.1 DUF2294 domain-containing protein [Paenibacillus sp. YPG26]
MNQLQSQQLCQQIASFTGKAFREHFGKGPESVVVSFSHKFTTIYLRSFLINSERVLLEQNQESIIRQIRDQIMQRVIPEITGYLKLVLGMEPEKLYYDWEFDSKSGMLIASFPEPIGLNEPQPKTYPGKLELEREIVTISGRVQKEPLEISSYEINPRTLLVLRQGVLGEMEKELIRLEHGEILRDVKRRLEKGYITRSSQISSSLGRTIAECFMDWDEKLDQSITVVVTNPPR